MKKLLLFIFILFSMHIVSAISYEDAISIGKGFIKEKAAVGSRGILTNDYSINVIKVYQNKLFYRIIYELKSNSVIKKRGIMLDIKKDTGRIVRVYISKSSVNQEPYF